MIFKRCRSGRGYRQTHKIRERGTDDRQKDLGQKNGGGDTELQEFSLVGFDQNETKQTKKTGIGRLRSISGEEREEGEGTNGWKSALLRF